ncbi:SpoIIE family protein phosphatase [Luedemannella helvata]|uniref:SpoIIE family protein phosphatase n=1 Tax=Luedemannella helvata TaxID=349315 RepID=A0ABP4WGK1_9ACTN
MQAQLGDIRDALRVDTVTVLLLDPYGRELVATASLGLEEEVAQGVRLPVGKGFAGRVAGTRAPVQLTKVDAKSVLNPLLINRGIRSILGVPMIYAGQLLGVLHVGSLRPRRFTAGEIRLLQASAEGVARAIRTQLAQLDRATTVALQRSLLPARHIDMAGLEVATRYVPGAREGVGGDWYDVFSLPSGHVGVVIGDVAGHGLRAAVVMGRIRSALRAYALESDDPADVLSRLDRKVGVFEPGAMATAVYAVIQPGLATMRLSVAGHPPPIVAEPGQPARVMEVRPDLPLGVRMGSPRRSSDVPLVPGEIMLFYTDGLIERRTQPLSHSVSRLRTAVSAGPAEAVCAAVMAAMIGDEQAVDDVAVLALSRPQSG